MTIWQVEGKNAFKRTSAPFRELFAISYFLLTSNLRVKLLKHVQQDLNVMLDSVSNEIQELSEQMLLREKDRKKTQFLSFILIAFLKKKS